MNTPETTRRGFLGIAAAASGATALAAQAERAGDPELRALVSQADLHYSKPVPRSEEGIPIGNGRMGTLVWTTPGSLRFQINRVDVYANNSYTTSFCERHNDYCGGCGFVDLLWHASHRRGRRHGTPASSLPPAGLSSLRLLLRNGHIGSVEIESRAGATCRLRNPFGGAVSLRRNSIKAETVEGDLLTFNTAKGEHLLLTRV